MILIKKQESKIGEVRNNKTGTPMQIIRYNNTNDITLKFLDKHGFEMDNTYQNFKEGKVSNPYDKRIHGIGYLGIGKYYTDKTKLEFQMYCCWRKILERCYSERFRHLNPAYEDCTTCKEWHCYQNFAQWYMDNYYLIENERTHVDKDILVKGNRVYSPETCLLVPQRINMIFMSKTNKWNLPNGISVSKTGKYITSYNTAHLGTFNTLDEAIKNHELSKRIHIKQVAEEYKNIISEKVYDALLEW